jgi:cytochrome b561
LVLAAQNTTDKKLKGDFMFYHKSFGVLAFILAGPRVIMRLTSASPGPLPGSSAFETIAAKAGHLALYALGIFLPVSGVVMGSFSGFGLPFFFTTIPSIEKKPPVAKQAYELHKIAGQVLEYIIPLHVAGALFHVAKGQPIMARILSIGSKSKAPKA